MNPSQKRVMFSALLFFGWVHWLIQTQFSDIVKTSYMDEEFHVLASERYCVGNFSAHPKITTPPGLYAITASVHAILGVPCDLSLMRGINSVFSILTMSVISNQVGFKQALVMHLLPTSFFFSFLHYTDAGGLFFTILCYCIALSNRSPKASAFAGIMAILFRQTNVVWVAFTAFEVALAEKALFPARARPLWIVCAGFAVFVVFFNEGRLALGDADNHEASLHIAQFWYAVLFTCAPLFHELSARKDVLRCIISPSGVALLACVVASMLYGAMGHPFLLSDNRHFTFYAWRWVLKHYPLRVALSPLFASSALLAVRKLTSAGKSMVWIVGFVAAASAPLVLSPLIEPRYYIPVATIFHLNVRHAAPTVSVAVLTVTNIWTLHLFLNRPFEWADGSLARFMF